MTKSAYADRDTVGTIALKARDFHDNPCAGDLGHELMPSLVEDLNDTIKSNPYDDRPFFISIHEKKDLLLKNAILRRMVTTEKRPYPEPNTSVFWTCPKTQETRFCWSLPHWSVFPNYASNKERYVQEQLEDIDAYLKEDLAHFGFAQVGMKDDKPILIPNPNFKDRKMGDSKKTIILSM